MKIPAPGKPVRGSQSGAPIMALFDLLGRRWAMGIVWILSEQGPCTFRELQEKCDNLSPTTLNTRIAELRAACLVDRDATGYRVTPRGRELYEMLVPLGLWAKEWGKDLQGVPVTQS
ncbi:winged helix-turn-helix transcriptional regulator [Thalassospira xiamenensis]|uniref:winged helix-turn-helix transcriptional regulator n=2 Tax=Thalassospira TaxID=168934 RepID=UPI00200032EC|nr:helix-turn-helix domain-containing protein [Thalassospira xiamenensis]MCK2166463.1 helix-turn-helix transcriptional regulator [Thalassospira xiamenensis]